MNDAAYQRPLHGRVLAVIATALVLYGLAPAVGWTVATAEDADHVAARGVRESAHPWAIIPFATLLGAIAVLPLLEQTAHWWERNLNKFYLALFHPDASLGHAAETLRHVVVADYVPFIVLLFSLYTISGGIRIEGDL